MSGANPDPFDPARWETGADEAPGRAPAAKATRPPRRRKADRFLKGPVPWPWLVRAMALPGKALAVGLMLWREAGCRRQRTVYFSLARAVADGIPTATARRAVWQLERAGLVTVYRKPGHGLEVTLNDGAAGGPTTNIDSGQGVG
jgi:hypothetical protein